MKPIEVRQAEFLLFMLRHGDTTGARGLCCEVNMDCWLWGYVTRTHP